MKSHVTAAPILRPGRAPWRPLAALALAMFTVGAILLHGGARAPGEVRVLRDIHASAPQWLDSLMVWVSRLGSAAAIVVLALGLGGYLALRGRVRSGVVIIGSVGAASVVTALVKLAVARARPHVFPWLTPEGGYSFPSGHSTAAMALALAIIALAWHGPRRVIVAATAIPLAVAVGVSRLVLGVHYPTDVLAGWFVAAATVVGVSAALRRFDVVRVRREPSAADRQSQGG